MQRLYKRMQRLYGAYTTIKGGRVPRPPATNRQLHLVTLAVCVATICVPGSLLSQQPEPADTAEKAKKEGELPLEPTRNVQFTTSEGTWMSLDVSPDGRTIVFELLGDLYTLPIEGGAAARITNGIAYDAQPRYSPDGDAIVFVSDRSGSDNLWLIDPDGSNARQLTKGSAQYISPTWTPDGEYIVVSRTQGVLGSRYELHLYHRDGGSGIEVTTGNDSMNAMGAAFGPDSRYIYFSRKRGGFGYNLMLPQWQIAVYDRRTAEYHQQTAAPGSAMRPILSPDGRWLVYATRHDGETGLRLRSLTTGDEQWLRYPVQRDDQESRFTRDVMPASSFTPDSRALITSYGGKIWRVEVPSGQAAEIPFTAAVDLDLGPRAHFQSRISDSAVTVRQIRGATPSPNSDRIVFTALDRLWVADLPPDTVVQLSAGLVRLTDDTLGEHTPTWSSDGRWIVYATWDDAEGGHLYRMRSNGRGNPRRLTTAPGYYLNPVYSPDASRILVIRGPRYQRMTEQGGPGLELVWIPADGGEATLITRVPTVSKPHFVTGEPDRVYYYEGRNGLVSFRYDGTDRREHVKVTGYKPPGPNSQPLRASEMLMAPDGRRVLAEVANQVYLVTVPLIGKDAPSISVTKPDDATLPVRQLTDVAGDFLGWSPDGSTAYWSLGRFFFRYNIAIGDSVARLAREAEAAEKRDAVEARGEEEKIEADSAEADTTKADDEKPDYKARRLEMVITVPRDIPRGSVVLRGARIITMRGDEMVERGDVLVTNNRVARICPDTCSGLPIDAVVITVVGKTIIPGFVDIHAHLRPPRGVHKRQVWEYLANLAWGITTTRDPQTGTTDVLSYGDMVETGQILGPRIFSTGPGVFWRDDISDLDEARDVLRRYSDYYQTGTIKQYVAGNRKQRQWVIMAAQELGLMPTTEGALDMKMNITEMIDGYPGHEHSWPITPLYEDVIQLAAKSGIVYTPTLLVAYGGPWAENYFYERQDIHDDERLRRFTPHNEIDRRALRRRAWFRDGEYVHPRIAAQAAKLVRAGGRVGLGGHGQLQGLGAHWELWAIQSGGMDNHDALRVATIFGAEAIGLDQDVGSLEPGKLADLIVLEENPLDDIRNTNTIVYVMKNGRLYDGDTLNEIWPRERELPKQWWWDQDP